MACGSVYEIEDGRPKTMPLSKGEGWGECYCCGSLPEDRSIKLTGTRRVPVKQPVRKRVSVTARIDEGGMASVRRDGSEYQNEYPDHPECHGKTGTLTFSWEE